VAREGSSCDSNRWIAEPSPSPYSLYLFWGNYRHRVGGPVITIRRDEIVSGVVLVCARASHSYADRFVPSSRTHAEIFRGAPFRRAVLMRGRASLKPRERVNGPRESPVRTDDARPTVNAVTAMMAFSEVRQVLCASPRIATTRNARSNRLDRELPYP
jgi:hypothetical protein